MPPVDLLADDLLAEDLLLSLDSPTGKGSGGSGRPPVVSGVTIGFGLAVLGAVRSVMAGWVSQGAFGASPPASGGRSLVGGSVGWKPSSGAAA